MATSVGVLLPLRIETRFYGNRLRLRVIPDEPWLDRHDPLPSAAELDALDRYLTAAGGGPPAGDKALAAWASFGQQVGAARGVWLLRSFPASGPDADGRWACQRPPVLRKEPRFTELAGLPEQLEVWLARGGGPRSSQTRSRSTRRCCAWTRPTRPTRTTGAGGSHGTRPSGRAWRPRSALARSTTTSTRSTWSVWARACRRSCSPATVTRASSA